MKVFLRNPATGLFYTAFFQWTSERDDARDFQYPERAVQLSREEKLTGMEMLFCYDVPRCDLVVPLIDGG